MNQVQLLLLINAQLV